MKPTGFNSWRLVVNSSFFVFNFVHCVRIPFIQFSIAKRKGHLTVIFKRDSFLIFARRFGCYLLLRRAKIFGHRSQNNTPCCFENCVRILLLYSAIKQEHPLLRMLLFYGGERGIRTLGTVLAFTRFPVVRLRPAQPSLRTAQHWYDIINRSICQYVFEKNINFLLKKNLLKQVLL